MTYLLKLSVVQPTGDLWERGPEWHAWVNTPTGRVVPGGGSIRYRAARIQHEREDRVRVALARMLKRALQRDGRSQRTLAAITGITQAQISRIASGRRPIRDEHLDALARVLMPVKVA